MRAAVQLVYLDFLPCKFHRFMYQETRTYCNMQRVMKMATSQAPLNKVYAEEMRNHPYGYALYQPTSSSIIKPGVVGFFDKTGFWSPLADLNDEEGLKAAGLSPPSSKLVAAPDQLSTWGVMTSKSTSGQNFEANPSIGLVSTDSIRRHKLMKSDPQRLVFR